MSFLNNEEIIVYNGKVYGTFSSNFERVIDIYAQEFFDTDNLEYSEPRSYNVINYTERGLPYDDFACNCFMIKPANYSNNTRVEYGIDLYDNNGDIIDDARQWVASDNLYRCRSCNCALHADDDDIYTDDDGEVYCESCYSELFTYCDNCSRTVNNDDIVLLSSVNTDDGAMYYCDHCVPQCNVCNNDDATHYIGLNNGNILVCDDCLSRMQTNCIVCNEPVVRHHRAIGYHHHHNHGARPIHLHKHCSHELHTVLSDASLSGNIMQSDYNADCQRMYIQ